MKTHQGGKETGFAEYRFNQSGKPVFLKSSRFSPVRSRGVITGYVDNVAKMSIPAKLLQSHIASVNRAAATQTKQFKEFQFSSSLFYIFLINIKLEFIKI